MIHITRITKPVELTDELQKELTEAYIKDNSKRVWDKPYIRGRLLEMTHYKCCYCERKVGAGETDMHVEHFRPKSLYPQEVLSWDNLLPSCPDCNRSKDNHDTVKKPIINPADEEPKQFFYINHTRYESFETSTSSKANVTIDILGLNDLEKKCAPRYKIIMELLEAFKYLCQDASAFKEELNTNTRKKNNIVTKCRDLLHNCTPSAAYSAFTATALEHDSNYWELKKILKDTGLWNEELEDLEKKREQCVFEVSNTRL